MPEGDLYLEVHVFLVFTVFTFFTTEKVDTHTHTRAYAYICRQTHIHIYIYTYIQVYTHVCKYVQYIYEICRNELFKLPRYQ